MSKPEVFPRDPTLGQKAFFRWYRRALGGDRIARRFFARYALLQMEQGRLLPRGLGKYFARLVKSPDFAVLMQDPEQKKQKKRRGRPPMEDVIDQYRRRLEHCMPRFGNKRFRPFFGKDAAERSALMLAYLHSLGHPISEAGNTGKESAIALVAEVTGRSSRQIQRDYAKHKSEIQRDRDSALKRGCAIYRRKKELPEIAALYRTNRQK